MRNERSTSFSAGFSLLEVIAAIAILAVLAAVVVPSTTGTSQYEAISSTKGILDSVRLGQTKYYTPAKHLLGALHMLAAAPNVGETSTCDGTEPGGNVTKYVAADSSAWTGPYMREVASPTGGLPTPIGVIDDRIKRNFAALGTLGTNTLLIVTMRDVRLEDAQVLNNLFDPANEAVSSSLANNLGFIRFTAPDASLVVVLTYNFAAPGKEC